jgi:NADH-quinone oxidoreductase subunit N
VPQLQPLVTGAVVLLLGGLAFKVAAVPLHAWAPATYDGAPTPVAAYLSTASKLGGVLAVVAVLDGLFGGQRDVAGPVLAALAVATMTVGNVGALRQQRMVRLLAWSSVAQAGYILAPLGVYAASRPRLADVSQPESAALAYTVIYVLLELAAFAAVVALRGAADGGLVEQYRGALRSRPLPAAALALAMIGLAGLPPGLAGMFAKVVVVRSLLAGGTGWLALVVAVNAVLGLAYYLRVVSVLAAEPPAVGIAVPAAEPQAVGGAVLAAEPAAVAGPVLSGERRAGAGAVPAAGTVTLAEPPTRRYAEYLPVPARAAVPVVVVLVAVTLVAVVLGFAPQLVFDAVTP